MAELARRTKMQTKQLEQLNHQIEVRASQVKNLALRSQWQQAKTIKNYQSEYDRIRNHLANNAHPKHHNITSQQHKEHMRRPRSKSFRLHAVKTKTKHKYSDLRYGLT